jgi:hypothetical protein
MIDENIDDIDYEHMDDLPLSAHIEWHHTIEEEVVMDELYEMDWLLTL